MVSTTTTTTMSSMMLYLTVIIASCILSVDAIRCHQCNSHLQEDCNTLRLITPRAPLDKQYLIDCEEPDAFCRKTVTKIEITGEKRIIRSCGKIDEKDGNDVCFDADNEGFKQTICSCHQDGCNSAPALRSGNALFMMSLSIVCVLAFTWLRRND